MGNNIFCRDSNLSSWCTRLLIERYAAGDTASKTKTFIETGHMEPTQADMKELVDRSMKDDLSTYDEIQALCRNRAEMYPQFWKEIRISRQTVNRYFLLLGEYFWKKAAEPEFRRHAERTAKLAFELYPKECAGFKFEDVVNVWIDDFVRDSVNWANGVLPKKMGKHFSRWQVNPHLTERAKRYNGLSLERAKEHIAWAFVVAGNIEGFGTDDRKRLASILASLLIKDPM